ncbi:hypothetical protein [Gordonia sp. (in: high G+C Gram-positive bacteria)]|uniref:hypothetical protein n=1 Tax=Gordonia sp. (in: high G+C Gram-positive bacteria) TaxID=84139 RepID=UPI003C7327CA
MSATTFTLDELPDVTFTVERGSGGEPGLPSTWITIVGTQMGTTAPTDDIPNPTPVAVEVFRAGFVGP